MSNTLEAEPVRMTKGIKVKLNPRYKFCKGYTHIKGRVHYCQLRKNHKGQHECDHYKWTGHILSMESR